MLNTEKDFDFRRKKLIEEKSQSIWRKIFLWSVIGLFIFNGISFYQLHNYRKNLQERMNIAQVQYENIVQKLNSYNLERLEHVDANHELIKDLKQLADNNLLASDWYLVDLVFQLEQDKKIKSKVKDEIYKEYESLIDQGLNNQEKITSCILDLPCFLQKRNELKDRINIVGEISEKRGMMRLYRQVENFPPPQIDKLVEQK